MATPEKLLPGSRSRESRELTRTRRRNRHTLSLIVLVFALAFGAGPSVAQTDDDLRAIWRAGNLVRMEEIARTGDARAQAWLGLMLQNRGKYFDALKWHRSAAEQGNLWAIMNVAHMYDRGIGMPKNRAEAVRWYRRAAELGSAYGQMSYADALLDGDGVPRNAQQAAYWYSAAAAQGERHAFLPLAKLYARGNGVQKDSVQAYALASVAEAVLNDSDLEPQREAADLRAALAKELTPEQIEAAAKRADELR